MKMQTLTTAYSTLRRNLAAEGWRPGPPDYALIVDIKQDVNQATSYPCRSCKGKRLRPRMFHRRESQLRTFVICERCCYVEER